MTTSRADKPSLTDAQRGAIERIADSLAVTSGAGCGKTFVLARRYLQALRADGAPDAVGRVVAVTFTDKATLEMRARVGGLIRAELVAATAPAERELLSEWLGRLPAARISTIHGFCASLLRRHAIEAGVDPGFAVLAEEFPRRRMLSQACRRAMLADLQRDDSDAAALLDQYRPDQLLELLGHMVDRRERWSAEAYADPQATLDRWRSLLKEIFDRQWDSLDRDATRRRMARLAAIDCSKDDDKLLQHVRETLAAVAILLERPDSRTIQRMDDLYKPGGVGSAKAWEVPPKQVRDLVKQLVEPLRELGQFLQPLNELDDQAAVLLKHLTALATRAGQQYMQIKRAGGVLDFSDLLVLSRDLLRDQPDVRRAVAGDIGALLIDEFQDTDALQRELLWLATGAAGMTPEPGRVFFVGDAKQSIYRFRGAEVDVFQAARDAMGDANRLALDLNFRTHARGIALVNDIFAPLMGAGYEPLQAHRQEPPPAPAAELALLEPDPDDPAAVTRRKEATMIARRIADLLAGPPTVWDDAAGQWRTPRAGDVAVLIRQLKWADDIEQALADAGVESHVVAGAGLFRQPEVFDLINALRAIDDPLDDVALAGLLRGGMVGLDDNALAHLSEVAQPPYRPQLRDPALAERLGSAQADRLAWCVDWLDELAWQKDQLGLAGLIERLLERTGYESALLAQYRGRRKAGNIHRILALAHEAESQQATLRQFADDLAELTVEEVRAEQAASEAAGRDAVQIMTIHKAKGLEFPAVFLVGQDAGAGGGREGDASISRELGLTLRLTDDDGDAKPAVHTVARLLDTQADREEDLRLFYVAVTRHRDFLCLTGALPRRKDGSLRLKGSNLERLDELFDLEQSLQVGQIRLGDGSVIHVTTPPAEIERARRSPSLLEQCLAQAQTPDELAKALHAPSAAVPDGALPHLPSRAGRGLIRLAPTALAELERCVRGFRWQYVLRVPEPGRARATSAGDGADLTGGTQAGTIIHQAMELLDFDAPQSARVLLDAAAGALERSEPIDPLVAPFGQMLDRFLESDLFKRIASAERRLREAPFVLSVDQAELTGVIDLIIADDRGWEIIDYKSDRVAAEDVPKHAGHYLLQMQVYSLAGARRLGRDKPTPVTLHYLRPGVSVSIEPEHLPPDAVQRKVTDLVDRLRTALQTDHWPSAEPDQCVHCRWRNLCRR